METNPESHFQSQMIRAGSGDDSSGCETSLEPESVFQSAKSFAECRQNGCQRGRAPSLVEYLLSEIYDSPRKKSLDDSVFSDSNSSSSNQKNLQRKSVWELQVMRNFLDSDLSQVAAVLVKQLKKKDRLTTQRERHCQMITAILQAASQKRRQDTRMRFSIEPPYGDSGFQQWHDAMRMVARLPGGVPPEFRGKLWLTLAEEHLKKNRIHWEEAEKFCFNDKSNPDDEDLGAQIVRDLHRTGCSLFCGDEAVSNQALLKRVLLAYARWNKAVGYCQGLNVLAALLLEVMDKSEVDSLKVMIYLIEGVLPEEYFGNNLRGLSIDMAVFRDLLKQRFPALSKRLEKLQTEARDSVTNTIYEPPLTNVFTMQWFLTLFATCLPKPTVLRIWDLIFLEGNEILLRTALAIWDALEERVLTVDTADDFYSIMGVLAREMVEFGLTEPNRFVQTVVNMAEFPFPGLAELRDKYRYNITPWAGGPGGSVRLFYSDEEPEVDDEDDEKTTATVAMAFGLASVFRTQMKRPASIRSRQSSEKEKLQLDIAALRKQYAKLRERQKQAHVICTAVTSAKFLSEAVNANNTVSNLLAGRKALLTRRPSSEATSGTGPKLLIPAARAYNNKANSAPSTPLGKESSDSKRGNPVTEFLRDASFLASFPRDSSPSPAKTVSNRSSLARELMEENNAILRRLKDKTDTVVATPKSASSGQNYNPFPKQTTRSPKDLPIKLGLYHQSGKI